MQNHLFNIVLLEPEIHSNTGNIARTCAATGTRLHLIKPYGFEITDKNLRRAGLDYWHLVDIREYESLADFTAKNEGANIYYLSTKAEKRYSDARFAPGDYIMFGKETKGLPESLLKEKYGNALRIPMISDARSLNLANSAAIVLYEALRQQDFAGLSSMGQLL